MPGTTEPVEEKADDVAQETVALTETAAAPSVDTGLTAEEEARVGELLGRIFGVSVNCSFLDEHSSFLKSIDIF